MTAIPFCKLDQSPSNVRKVYDEAADEQLSYDIEAHGQLQNLIVTKSKKRTRFDVIAGGRRLRAMNMIVERGAWDKTHDVECLVIDGKTSNVGEVSFAENFQRLAMTPTEECRAFQHFVTEDGDSAAVAKRFGLTQRFVEGRLRLANLAEPIFEALEAGDITLDLAKAYASTDRHEVQLRVFEQARYNTYLKADAIRRMIAEGSLRGTDPIALLVGEEAYVAEGGRVERDLFSEASEDRWLDIPIAHELAAVLMESEATRLVAETGLAWVRPVAATSSWHARSEADVHAVRLPPAPISEEAQTRIDEIEARMSEIGDIFEAYEVEPSNEIDIEALEAEYEEIDEERRTLSNPKRELPEEWKGEVGQFLILTAEGGMVLDPDYYSEKELRFEADEDGTITGGAFEAPTTKSGAAAKPAKPEAAAPGGKAVSARLFDELAVQRRNVLAASLLGDPGLALDYAIFALADARGYDPKGTTIRGGKADDPVRGECPTGEADQILADAHDALERAWQEESDLTDRFLAFRALDDDAKAAWLAYCVAISLEPKKGYASELHPIHALLGTILNVDVASLWRPTSENFFDRISKASCLAALTEIGGSELAARYGASKKTELSISCARLFSGDAIVEEDIKARAIEWVPATMRFELPKADANEVADTDGDAVYEDIDKSETDDVDAGDGEADDESAEEAEPIAA
ncbi:MAG: ParB/RepB/Spo0J family partition protein [Pseudomonadota bacterium]